MVVQTPPRITSLGMVACDGLKGKGPKQQQKLLFANKKDAEEAANYLWEVHKYDQEPYACRQPSCLDGKGWHLYTVDSDDEGDDKVNLPHLKIPDRPDWLPERKSVRRGRDRRRRNYPKRRR